MTQPSTHAHGSHADEPWRALRTRTHMCADAYVDHIVHMPFAPTDRCPCPLSSHDSISSQNSPVTGAAAIASTTFALLLRGHGHSDLPHFAHRHDHNTIDGARVSQCCVIIIETGWICCLSLSLFEQLQYNRERGSDCEKLCRITCPVATCSQQGVHNCPL